MSGRLRPGPILDAMAVRETGSSICPVCETVRATHASRQMDSGHRISMGTPVNQYGPGIHVCPPQINWLAKRADLILSSWTVGWVHSGVQQEPSVAVAEDPATWDASGATTWIHGGDRAWHIGGRPPGVREKEHHIARRTPWWM